jgi:FHS family L-fucose permease-like MFS transporter
MVVNYVQQQSVLGASLTDAVSYVPYYWGGSLAGRFLGSGILRHVGPGKVLAGNACGAIALVVLSANSTGGLAAWSLIAIGLMNSIMFPTIFSLACEGLGPRAADASGLINIAIFGGAVVPILTGLIADHSGSLTASLTLPGLCYAVIAGFGFYALRPVNIATA